MAVVKDKQILADKKQFDQILKMIDKDRRPIGEKLVKEITFMIKTLDDLKIMIEEHGTIELFKQGSNEYLRESPGLKAYNTTIQRYSLLYKQLEGLLPKTPMDTKGDALIKFINGK